MEDKLIISSSALPDVFLKVLSAKELLSNGTVGSISEAVRTVGISRSAFYKYRNHVFRYIPEGSGSILNFTASLADKAGVLSSVLSSIYNFGANIITVNQSLPVDGVASVAFSVRINDTSPGFDFFKKELTAIPGVKSVHQTV